MKSYIFLVIQKTKFLVEIFFPGYFSANCKAVKKIVNNYKINIETIYDIVALKGSWYEERKKLFQMQKFFIYLMPKIYSVRKF